MSTVTVVPTVELDSIPPRVRLDVTDTGSPELFSVTVTRLGPDGRTVPVRSPDGNALTLATSGSDRVGIAYDYEAPFGQPVSYSTEESPTVVSGEVSVDEDRVWLIHPGVPVLSVPLGRLRADSFAEEQWIVNQAVYWPMGRQFPVVQSDGQRKAPSSTITVRTETLQELAGLQAIVHDASTLLLNIPASLGLGVSSSYVSIGAIRNSRFVNIGGDPRRAVELPYQVVDRPVGGSQAARSYADILSTYGTYADVLEAYDDYFSLLAGP